MNPRALVDTTLWLRNRRVSAYASDDHPAMMAWKMSAPVARLRARDLSLKNVRWPFQVTALVDLLTRAALSTFARAKSVLLL
jgi:hypothetical protein